MFSLHVPLCTAGNQLCLIPGCDILTECESTMQVMRALQETTSINKKTPLLVSYKRPRYDISNYTVYISNEELFPKHKSVKTQQPIKGLVK